MTEPRTAFAVVPIELFGLRLSVQAIGVYAALALYRDKSHGCFPSVATISNLVGLAPSNVRRYIGELEKVGAIVREAAFDEAGRRTSNRYILRVGGRQPTGRRGDPPAGRRGDTPAGRRVTIPEGTIPERTEGSEPNGSVADATLAWWNPEDDPESGAKRNSPTAPTREPTSVPSAVAAKRPALPLMPAQPPTHGDDPEASDRADGPGGDYGYENPADYETEREDDDREEPPAPAFGAVDFSDREAVKKACYRMAARINPKRRSAPSELDKAGVPWPEIHDLLVIAASKEHPASYLAGIIQRRKVEGQPVPEAEPPEFADLWRKWDEWQLMPAQLTQKGSREAAARAWHAYVVLAGVDSAMVLKQARNYVIHHRNEGWRTGEVANWLRERRWKGDYGQQKGLPPEAEIVVFT